MDAKFIKSYFYSLNDENKITPTPQTLLLKKLVQLKKSGDEPFALEKMWTLYRDSEPASLFNGLFVLIENVAKCDALWKSNLLEFTNVTGKTFKMTGSVGGFARATPDYPSGYVKITKKGELFVSALANYEATGKKGSLRRFRLNKKAFRNVQKMFSGILY